jgi:hypothetical protein
VSACRSSDTPDDGIGGLLTAFRPVSRDSQPPAPGAASGKGRGVVSTGGCCATDSDSASVGRPASGTVIFWMTNLWRGDRQDDMTIGTLRASRVRRKQLFGRDLRAAVPSIRVTQPRGSDGKQYRAYSGITRREKAEYE